MPNQPCGRNKSDRESRCPRKSGLFGTKSQKKDKVVLHLIVIRKDKSR